MTNRSQRSSASSAAPIRKAIEPLENRQLFAGVVASERVFFPNPAAFAQFVHFEQVIAIDLGMSTRFGGPQGGMSNQVSSGDTSAATPTRSNAAAANSSVASVAATAARSQASDVQPVAPRTVLAADAQSATPDPAGPAVATAAALLQSVTPTNGATPATTANATPMVLVLAQNGKVFSERAVTIKIAAAAPRANVAGNGFVSLLNQPAKTSISQAETVAARTHRGEQTAVESDSQQLLAAAEKGPESVTLAAMPTGHLFFQPLWQRIAAASATAVILVANWMLRRKREQLSASAARRQA